MRSPLTRSSRLILLAGLGVSLGGCPQPSRDADEARKSDVARSIGVTRVRLDFVDRPIDEIVAGLEQRSGLPVALAKPGQPREPTTPPASLSLKEAEPISFWEALERLMRPANLQILTERGLFGPVELKLGPLRGVRGPVSFDGAFRCEILSLDHRRTLSFGKSDPPNTQGRPVPTRRGDSGPDIGPTQESLWVRVQIRPEPRPGLKFVSAGVPRVTEATDEKGRSLVLAGGEHHGVGAHFVTGGIGAMVAELPLAMPDPPAASIVSLKGVAPLVLRTTRLDPLDVPLANASGRSFEGSGTSLMISRCETIGSGPAAYGVVELVLRPGVPPSPTHWSESEGITFYDEQGKLVRGKPIGQPEPSGGMRFTYRFPGQVPTRLRIVGSVEASVPVNFEFADIPLP